MKKETMMKRAILCLFLLVLSQKHLSQTVRESIQEDWQNGRISETESVYFQALAAFIPHQLPETYRSAPGAPLKCATGLMMEIKKHWPKMDPDQKDVLKPFLQRPYLNFSHVSPSGRFRIHYNLEGEDAVSSDDSDQSGIPDYVEETARAVDTVYVIEVDTLGFKPPPSDQEQDGAEYDVYLIELSWAYGYTQLETQLSENPDTWSCFMVFDNDYEGFPTSSLDALRVTAAHEFNHMIQLGYNFRNDDLFMMEMTSTWMEDVVYDSVNDYYFYLNDFFNHTNIPFSDNNYSSTRMYGQCIWFHFLEARLGNRQFGHRVWEEIVLYPAVHATQLMLQELGHAFDEELALFYGWNYMTGSRADTLRFYPEGNHYPEIRMDGTYAFQQDKHVSGTMQPTASRYYRFDQNDSTSFALIPSHVNWWAEPSSGSFSLDLVHDGTDPLYTDLADGVQANMEAEPIEDWLCAGVADQSGNITFLLFSANSNVEDISVENSANPSFFSLGQNYPNPFNPTTAIPFAVPYPARVRITMYDILGREMETLIDQDLQRGSYRIFWNGEHMPSGMYLYRLEADSFQDTKKLFLQK
jgi:hypothetical protein